MEANKTYEDVLKKVAELIVRRNVRISFSNYGDSFMVMLFHGDGETQETVYTGYFYMKDSEMALRAKCEGFLAMVNTLAA